MPRLAQETIDEIRNSTDIVEIVKEYVPLTQRGKNFLGICPFHQDHSPSMSVSREKQIYKCFSCGAAGNVFHFVSEIESISYIDAVRKLGERLGMKLNTQSFHVQEKYEKEYEIMAITAAFYQNNLNTKMGLKAKEYLKNRGLDEEFQKEFGIGLSFHQNELSHFLEKKNVSWQDMIDLGLVHEKDLSYHDLFMNRILFPIHNAEGKVVGFTGRVYEKDATPKYLNSKETKIFRKGTILFNYHRAKEAIRREKKVIVVEGNMDAIRMYVSGFFNTVALMGTSLTKEQILLLQKFRTPILLMLDNDSAGALATMNVGDLLEKSGLTVEVVRLSGKKDPDEYILTYGVEAMRDNIMHPISFLDFKLQFLKEDKDLKDTSLLAQYVKNVLVSLQGKDAITVDITLNKLVEEYHLNYEVLKQELEVTEQKPKILPTEVSPPKKKQTRYELSVNAVLYYMMNDSKYIQMYQNELGYFKEAHYREIASEILYYYELHHTMVFADFLSYVETSPLKEEIMRVIRSINEEKLTETNMEEYLKMIKEITWKEKINSLKEEMKKTTDIHQKELIAMDITDLGKKIQEIRKERSVKND